MANKDQKRGNREVRKPKQAKSKSAAPASPFTVLTGKSAAGGNPPKR
jgi:hypothetical protein